ncbi:5-oxoprolinase subunit C family protein [Leeuwenhoekiella marinoflava]|uniref:Biotin-dependent carboxylase-like uncharacterized protein n=2 Tax=Leeuwenhoekiella marinoflava TaxID=988 RepID=A0A4Q0PQU9_9FLAO|nr:biotin-dependent carboxyltransferase family protein [Leeuwenhoekiella marinoflava]RXG32602.1 biotin-dependent carboxylase-like uncharacterized protein [Leeuwenhoekiella marinoflava]SHE65717.1 biotin-dependent carboxylase uncharacterized domain-containing protein [Leeuwenhoekiella marinoflava DSM 3653]
MPKVEVKKAGFYTTVQDLGRLNAAQYGVPRSGVMDSFSAKKANLLLNNPADAAVLEITMTGPTLLFQSKTQIAVCGAIFDMYLDECLISNAKAFQVEAGSVLRFSGLKQGFRAYLAIQQGFKTEVVLESRSQYQGITSASRLVNGEKLEIEALENSVIASARVNFEDQELFSNTIKTFRGLEFELLPQKLQKKLFTEKFKLTPAGNRMAIPFKELLPNDLKGILTGPVIPGTVQLTPKGNLIALMQDCQVTGGYPRVLQISERGLCKLAQKKPGETVTFQLSQFD